MCVFYFQGIDSLLDVYKSLENIAIVTLAPEIKGATQVIQQLSKRGVVVAVGHSTANLEQGETAVQHGATLITHLFNAMLPVRFSLGSVPNHKFACVIKNY